MSALGSITMNAVPLTTDARFSVAQNELQNGRSTSKIDNNNG